LVTAKLVQLLPSNLGYVYEEIDLRWKHLTLSYLPIYRLQ